MNTIYFDPVQMDATAGHIGEHVNELTTLTADLETACSAAVPASIAGWLAEELRDITVTARMIALLYSVAALDTAQRAQQIQADQSLATAAPSLAATSPAFTGAPLVGGFGAFGSITTGTGSTGSMVLGGAGGYLPLDSTSISSGSAGSMVLGGPGGYLPLDSTSISSGSAGSMVLGGPGVYLPLDSTKISSGSSGQSVLDGGHFLANNPLLGTGDSQLIGLHAAMNGSVHNQIGRGLNSEFGATYIGSGLFQGNNGQIGSQIYKIPTRPGEFGVG